MTLDNLIVKLRIEEDNKKIGGKLSTVLVEAKANLMECGEPSKKRKRPNDDQGKKPILGKIEV